MALLELASPCPFKVKAVEIFQQQGCFTKKSTQYGLEMDSKLLDEVYEEDNWRCPKRTISTLI